MDALSVVEKETTQYIVVKIQNEQYGLNIGYIDNIVRMQKITRVPKTKEYFKGIINLRGEIVPVMSIRLRMGRDDDVITNDSRIIILKIEDEGLLGIIVDEVKEVVNLSSDEIEPSGGKDSFINGVGKNGDELISLLEVSAIIENPEGN